MTNVFPTVFEFLNPKPDDVVHYVDYEANAALTIAEGPLEILGIERLNVVLAWKSQQEAKSYSTLVIPESRAKTLMVQKRHFKDKFIKNNYMHRKYTACTHLDFVSEKLYLIPQDPPNAVCLKSPNLFFFDPNAGRLRMAKNGIIFNPSSDEESYDSDDVYADIAPPIPERIPITCPQALQNVKKKLGFFHKIHDEIKSLFKRKGKSRRRKRRGEQMREPGECPSNPLYRRSKSMSDIDKLDDNAIWNVKNIRTMAYRKPSAPPPVCNDPQHSNIPKRSIPSTLNKFTSSFLTESFMKPTPRVPSIPSKSKSESSSPTDAYTTKTNSFSPTLSRSRSASRSPSEIRRESRPLSALVSSHNDEESDICIIPCPSVPPRRSARAPRSPAPHRPPPPIPLDGNNRNHLIANAEPCDHPEALPVTTHSEKANENAGYATISQKRMESILCPGQTSEDFYKYSVIELYHLLKHFNLHDIANICYDYRYDGKYFANVDVQELLQDQPFSASNIQILNLKKLQDGWRPNVSS
ncbi:uncharacterized protein LOC127862091 isoform X2 [Dreissena polymorpha]|uniref:uncharacterized protein LOC127862091 isoform X2 n=1 Tax=Dreissena polymorpha TaxID=45954 RepID=UPI00226557EA|nr:uncharacterized protein LOC127862091 isoform X2 [Dreissena polymorpha]